RKPEQRNENDAQPSLQGSWCSHATHGEHDDPEVARRRAHQVMLRDVHDAAYPGPPPATGFAGVGEAAFRELAALGSQSASTAPLDARAVGIHRLLLPLRFILPDPPAAALW